MGAQGDEGRLAACSDVQQGVLDGTSGEARTQRKVKSLRWSIDGADGRPLR